MDAIRGVQWHGWTIVRKIGQGSFGAVYEIERDLFGKKEKAALKHISIPQNSSDIDEMHSDGYDDESITATFQSHLESIVAEYSLMRKLNGVANIVNCDDVQYVPREGGFGWDIYIKMELLTPLTKALPEQIPPEMTKRLAEDMCYALILCKRFDIIHRDIKPQNIFVSPLGDYKLGDFGIAKTVEKTMGGTKTGTYKYMAPEVYNNRPYGHQADIYSLGLVLYWMLNKKRMPFMPLPPAKLTAGMDEQARTRRLSGEPLPPPADGSEALKRIVLKACAYDPKDRYHSADEMLKELEGGMALHAAVSTPPRAPQRAVHTMLPDEEEEELTASASGAARPAPAFEEAETVGAFGSVQNAAVGAFHGQAGSGNVRPASAQKKPASFPVQNRPAPAPEPEEEGTVGAFVGVEGATLGAFHAQTPIGNRTPTPLQSKPAPTPAQGRAKAAQNSQAQYRQAQNIPGNTQEKPGLRQNTPPAPNPAQDRHSGGKGKETALIAGIAAAVLCAALVVFLVLNKGSGKTSSSQGGNTFSGQVSATKQDPEESEQERAYQNAVQLLEAGEYDAALALFDDLGTYKNSAALAEKALQKKQEAEIEAENYSIYAAAKSLQADRKLAEAAAAFEALGGYRDSKERAFRLRCIIRNRHTVAAGYAFTVGLRADGTVVAVGYNDKNGQCDVSGWTDIVAISAGGWHDADDGYTVGLRADGTVVAVGDNKYGQCNVPDWTDVVAVAAGYDYTVGLRADGTVVAVGDNLDGPCNVSGWTDIVAISAHSWHTVGLRADGTVVAVGRNDKGQCDVSDWTDIVAVAAGFGYTVGLRADGTVVAVGDNEHGQCDVSDWTDIVSVAAGNVHTVGLRADGTVVAVGFNYVGQCDVSGWTDIVAVAAGHFHTVGLRADGTVVAVGENECGQCDVSDLRKIKLPE